MVEKGKPEIIKAELVLLAMGFLKPEHPQYAENVFVCGDAANGASLVVRAMASGKQTAAKVDASQIDFSSIFRKSLFSIRNSGIFSYLCSQITKEKQ